MIARDSGRPERRRRGREPTALRLSPNVVKGGRLNDEVLEGDDEIGRWESRAVVPGEKAPGRDRHVGGKRERAEGGGEAVRQAEFGGFPCRCHCNKAVLGQGLLAAGRA